MIMRHRKAAALLAAGMLAGSLLIMTACGGNVKSEEAPVSEEQAETLTENETKTENNERQETEEPALEAEAEGEEALDGRTITEAYYGSLDSYENVFASPLWNCYIAIDELPGWSYDSVNGYDKGAFYTKDGWEAEEPELSLVMWFEFDAFHDPEEYVQSLDAMIAENGASVEIIDENTVQTKLGETKWRIGRSKESLGYDFEADTSRDADCYRLNTYTILKEEGKEKGWPLVIKLGDTLSLEELQSITGDTDEFVRKLYDSFTFGIIE